MKRVIIALIIIGIILTACSNTEDRDISVWIIGDSMAAKSNSHSGWGEELQHYITSDVTIRNTAMGGASTSSYPNEIIYEMIFDNAKEGDYAIIMLGHNDAIHETRHTDPYGDSETEGSYKNLLKHKFIIPLLDIGVKPILTTCVTVPVFNGNETSEMLYASHAEAVRELYDECIKEGLEVELIDTLKITADYYEEIGEDEALEYHVMDGYYHYNLKGAVYAAGVIAEGMKELGAVGFEEILEEEEALKLAEDKLQE